MGATIKPLDPTMVSSLIATHIVRSASGTTPDARDLASAVNEVTIQTQTMGASLLVVKMTDPGWTITDHGFLSMDSDGLLDTIDINFPDGSAFWWRLAMVDASDSLTGPNLTLTFQDRIISYLQDKFGPKTVAPGTTTRAQFIKQLVDEVGHGDGLEPIRFVCQELNVLQPVASTSTSGGTAGSTSPIPSGAQLTMYDATGGSLSSIPKNAQAVASYVDGFGGYSAAVAMFPNAQHLSITAREPAQEADCIDVEPGACLNSSAAPWVKAMIAKGHTRPCIYTSTSNWPAVKALLDAAGLKRSDYRWWAAHWTYSAHIEPGADATQWTNGATGGGPEGPYDTSLCSGSFFGASTASPAATNVTTQFATTTVASKAQTAQASAQVNKTGGIGQGSKVTIKGAAPSAAQIALINQVMGIANSLNAGQLATAALLEACIAENDFTNNPGGGGGSNGILQLIPSTAAQAGISPLDVNGCVTAFLTNGYSPGGTGAIAYAKAHPTAPAYAVAQFIQRSGAGQSSNGASNYGPWLSEANAIIAAYGGIGIGGGTSSTGNAGGGGSDVSQLARGTTEDPDENSWSCIQRLAAEVNWMCFSNGDTLYYDDGPTIDKQAVAVTLVRTPGTVTWNAINPSDGQVAVDVVENFDGCADNTAFQNQATRKHRGKVMRQTRIRKPQTPTTIRFNMTCGALDYRAGDVFELQNSGPFTNKWIVEDATRNMLADTFTQFTLGPPTNPNPEPAAASTSTTGTATTPGTSPGGKITGTGTGVGAAQAAQQAMARQKSGHMFHYQQLRPINYAILTASPMYIDCSGFAISCYKQAGLPDPSHNNFDGAGYTGDMITHCAQVSAGQAQPGDLCFYGPSTGATEHVTVYIGNGNVISMGAEGDPNQGPAAQMGPTGFLGYWRPDVLAQVKPKATAPATTPTAPTAPIQAGGGRITIPGIPSLF